MNAIARIACVLIVALTTAPVIAGELAPQLRNLLEHFQESRRVASAYLRTRNIDFGAMEIEKLRDRWLADRRLAQPQAAADEQLVMALAETENLISASLQSIDAFDVERALAQLDAAGVPLRTWREANGIRFFSDYIAQVSAAYEVLDRYRTTPPRLVNATVREAILAESARVAEALVHCDREAPAGVRTDPEFRRLAEGMTASLRQMPQALELGDGSYLHRLLIEQRSFERLLVFRYG